MTRLDMKAIRARADAALRGPWSVTHDPRERDPNYTIMSSEPDVNGNRISVGPDCNYDACHSATTRLDDAAFIAAARADVPALCDRVEVLEAALRDVLLLAVESDDDLSTNFTARLNAARAALGDGE
jgi:hypothetical protein